MRALVQGEEEHMARTRKTEQTNATLGFEAELWSAADEMLGHLSAAE